jgi:hypothetical protein
VVKTQKPLGSQAGLHSLRHLGCHRQTLAIETPALESKMMVRLSRDSLPFVDHACRWLGFQRLEKIPDPESELTGTEWLCELALKRFESADRAFDSINNRTGVVIGFAGLFNSLLLPSWQKLPLSFRFFSGIIWGSLIALMLFNSLRAFQVTDVEYLPLKRSTAESFLVLTKEAARERWLSNLLDAAKKMEEANNKKASFLRDAIRYLGLQVATLLGVVLIAGVS